MPMHPTQRIGRYRLDRRLGSGAFGVVWLAHDDVLEAPVAVKVLAENWVQRMDVRERFLSEARLLRRADSNRVVQVFDIGELPDGRPYFVMEYADGGTLADRISDVPLPVAEALRLTAMAARGAAALHEAGIVHRDIKPSNVLFRTSPDGADRVLLADLGVAKSLDKASAFTMAVGSVGYMAPEQAGFGTGIDARADVYSLGALGYRLVTGVVPGMPGEVVRPDRLCPGLRPDVQHALLRAMEPDRERRWPTALGFAEELDRLASLARDGNGDGPRLRRRRVAVGLAAVTAVCAVGVTIALVTRQPAAKPVSVTDATARITAEVPASWARQMRDSGWNPQVLGLKEGDEPGLVVADDLSRWPDLTSDVHGVFIGLSEQGDVTSQVRAITHGGCHYAGSHSYTSSAWQGEVRTWTGCPGSGGSFTEAGLTPAGSSGQPQVYVQIRQGSGGDATDRILGSVRVGQS